MQSDPISSPMSVHRTYQLLDARPARSRRIWSDAARERIIAEACVPGANVSAIARSYDMAPSQLFKWRREAQRPSDLSAASDPNSGSRNDSLSFVEVASIGGGIGQNPPAGLCELHISDATIRIGDGVCIERIIDLIRAVRRA
jgi:transposase